MQSSRMPGMNFFFFFNNRNRNNTGADGLKRSLTADHKPSVKMHPVYVVRALGAIWVFLLGSHLCGLYVQYGLGHSFVYGLVPFFDLDVERNAPSLFSASLFLFNGILFLRFGPRRAVRPRPMQLGCFSRSCAVRLRSTSISPCTST